MPRTSHEIQLVPEPSELAIIASGPFQAESVVRCAEQAISKKKGQAVRTALGSFLTVRDQRGTSGEVAVRDAGPLVISNGRVAVNRMAFAKTPTSSSSQ